MIDGWPKRNACIEQIISVSLYSFEAALWLVAEKTHKKEIDRWSHMQLVTATIRRIQYVHLPRTRAASIVSSIRRTNEFVVLFVPLFPSPRPLVLFCVFDAVCDETNSPKSYRYHPGLWSGKKWLCCKTINRTAFGCQAATHWSETNNNPTSSKYYHFILHSIQKRFVSISLSIACYVFSSLFFSVWTESKSTQ